MPQKFRAIDKLAMITTIATCLEMSKRYNCSPSYVSRLRTRARGDAEFKIKLRKEAGVLRMPDRHYAPFRDGTYD